MALHPQVVTLLELVAAVGAPPVEESTPEEARAVRAALLRPSPEPIGEVGDIDVGGVPGRLYRPVAARSAGLLVYLHGGGFVLGDLDSHDDPCRALANRAGCTVLSVGYRLAPEHPFPAAVDDASTAARWAHQHAAGLGCDPSLLAVGGDSAGANLAAVVANEAAVPLCFQLLVYPCADPRMTMPSIAENGDGYFLTSAGMRWFYDHYTGAHVAAGGSLDDPRLNLLAAPVAAAPPAMVITAEYDPLRDDGEAYARRLADAGVATSLVQFHGQIHGFFSMFGLLDDARSAHALAGEALHTAFTRGT